MVEQQSQAKQPLFLRGKRTHMVSGPCSRTAALRHEQQPAGRCILKSCAQPPSQFTAPVQHPLGLARCAKPCPQRQKPTHQALILTAGLHVLGCSFFLCQPPSSSCPHSSASRLRATSNRSNTSFPHSGLAIVIQRLMPQQSPNHAPPPEIVDRLSAQSDCFVSNTPWAHQRTQEGWLRPVGFILEHQHNRQTELSDWLHQQSCAFLVIDLNYPYPQHIEDGLLSLNSAMVTGVSFRL